MEQICFDASLVNTVFRWVFNGAFNALALYIGWRLGRRSVAGKRQ